MKPGRSLLSTAAMRRVCWTHGRAVDGVVRGPAEVQHAIEACFELAARAPRTIQYPDVLDTVKGKKNLYTKKRNK